MSDRARLEEVLGVFREMAVEPWAQRDDLYEGDWFVEAWHGRRKVSVYLHANGVVDTLKVWGPNINTQMEEGDATDSLDALVPLIAWLREG